MYDKISLNIYNKLLLDGIINTKGKITVEFLNTKLFLRERSAIGNILEEWLKKWLIENNFKFEVNENSQMPPDLYLNIEDRTKGLVEVKAFDMDRGPNFDLANYDAFITRILEDTYALNADYLIFGYRVVEDNIQITGFWLKKIWEITCGSNQYSVKVQCKRGKIYNIRPANWNSKNSKFPIFNNRRAFVEGVYNTILKYGGNPANINKDSWFKEISENFLKQNGEPL